MQRSEKYNILVIGKNSTWAFFYSFTFVGKIRPKFGGEEALRNSVCLISFSWDHFHVHSTYLASYLMSICSQTLTLPQTTWILKKPCSPPRMKRAWTPNPERSIFRAYGSRIKGYWEAIGCLCSGNWFTSVGYCRLHMCLTDYMTHFQILAPDLKATHWDKQVWLQPRELSEVLKRSHESHLEAK